MGLKNKSMVLLSMTYVRNKWECFMFGASKPSQSSAKSTQHFSAPNFNIIGTCLGLYENEDHTLQHGGKSVTHVVRNKFAICFLKYWARLTGLENDIVSSFFFLHIFPAQRMSHIQHIAANDNFDLGKSLHLFSLAAPSEYRPKYHFLSLSILDILNLATAFVSYRL